jgi:hypothetical protein
VARSGPLFGSGWVMAPSAECLSSVASCTLGSIWFDARSRVKGGSVVGHDVRAGQEDEAVGSPDRSAERYLEDRRQPDIAHGRRELSVPQRGCEVVEAGLSQPRATRHRLLEFGVVDPFGNEISVGGALDWRDG